MLIQDHARTLLTAWDSGDRTLLGKLLDERVEPGAAPAEEEERLELLDGIRCGLNGAESQDAPAVRVSLRLLRHLAFGRN